MHDIGTYNKLRHTKLAAVTGSTELSEIQSVLCAILLEGA